MTESLLPYNASTLEIALADTMAAMVDLPLPIGDLHDPMRCPAQLLPWLAWQLSVEDWDEAWTEKQRRSYLAAAIEIQAHKGTRWAVEQALEALGYGVKLSEWFEYGGEPKRFKVDVDLADDLLPEVLWETFYRRINQWKNARSHLEYLRFYRTVESNFYIAGAPVGGSTVTVYPEIVTEAVVEWPYRFATATQTRETVSIYPPSPSTETMIEKGYWLASVTASAETMAIYPIVPPSTSVFAAAHRLATATASGMVVVIYPAAWQDNENIH